MFIFTTKFNKKKAIAAVLLLAAILVVIVLIAGSKGTAGKSDTKETAALSAVVRNNEQRVNYLKALGWEVEQSVLEQQNIVIPREFTDVYKKYNELQLTQGFDLSKFGGVKAIRYTYLILNYPEATSTVVADIIVYKNEVIAGDVQSNMLDGFMAGLQFPAADTPEVTSDAITTDEATAEEASAGEADAVSNVLAEAEEEPEASPPAP